MADKFTRRGASEGDVWYATTVGGATSIESMEDAIDAKMLAFIGEDQTGGSIANSVVETQIGEVQVAANSVNTEIVVYVYGRFVDSADTATDRSTNVKLYIGVNAAFGSNSLIKTLGVEGLATQHNNFSFMKQADAGDFTGAFTSLVYVHVTGTNSVAEATTITKCEGMVIIGA